MITNEKVDMLISSGTPDTVNPAADQAEALGCPMVCTNNPMEAFIFGRGMKPDTVQTYPYGLLFGVDQELITQPMAFDKVQTNKNMGILLANEVDGNTWASIIVDGFQGRGLQRDLPSAVPAGTEDFTVQIAAFKKAGCEILTGTHYPNDFTNFWNQAQQQGYKPRLVFIGGKCFSDFSFPNAVGDTLCRVHGQLAAAQDFHVHGFAHGHDGRPTLRPVRGRHRRSVERERRCAGRAQLGRRRV